jgi:hypothetical protein
MKTNLFLFLYLFVEILFLQFQNVQFVDCSRVRVRAPDSNSLNFDFQQNNFQNHAFNTNEIFNNQQMNIENFNSQFQSQSTFQPTIENKFSTSNLPNFNSDPNLDRDSDQTRTQISNQQNNNFDSDNSINSSFEIFQFPPLFISPLQSAIESRNPSPFRIINRQRKQIQYIYNSMHKQS